MSDQTHARATSRSVRRASRAAHWFTALLGLVACAPLNHGVRSTEPTGFGKVTFGESIADFLKFYPDAMLRPGATSSRSRAQMGIIVYRVERQKVGPLNDCAAAFRFFGTPPALVDVRFSCPARGEVRPYLIDQFGPPTHSTPAMLTWGGRKTVINYSPQTDAFDYSDRERAFAMQVMLIKLEADRMGKQLPQ